jgi:hypothetical protein
MEKHSLVGQLENPYASPQTAPERPIEAPSGSVWQNRLAMMGFLLSLLFPAIALGGLAALFLEDEFGTVRWRVHRMIRLFLFRSSFASLAASAISIAGLRTSPRRLAIYGLIIGLMGSSYWLLAMLGVLRR